MTSFFWADVRWRTVVGVVVIISAFITFAWWLTAKTDPPKPMTVEEYLLQKNRTDAARDSLRWKREDSLAMLRYEEEMRYRLSEQQREDSIAVIHSQEIQSNNEIIKKINRTTDSDNAAWFAQRYGTK